MTEGLNGYKKYIIREKVKECILCQLNFRRSQNNIALG